MNVLHISTAALSEVAVDAVREQRSSEWLFLTELLIAGALGGLYALGLGGRDLIAADSLTRTRRAGSKVSLLGLVQMIVYAVAMFGLGAIALYGTRYLMAEHIYPWLEVLLGITVIGLGMIMLLQQLGRTALVHEHGGGGVHWFLDRVVSRAAAGPGDVAQSFTAKMAGRFLSSPAALVVLLSAISLPQIVQGLFLMSAFCVGTATVSVCLPITHAGMDGLMTRRWRPIVKASLVMVLGALVSWQGFAATSLLIHLAATHRLGPLFVIGMGLVLGMRHSTDADHVVAISTIVSRQHSIRGAAFIGSVWGIGHTITIFIVGSLIILFNVEIPVRLGLSMEFSVAVMLVLLGITNLTGAMQWVTQRLTATDVKRASEITEGSLNHQERLLQRTVGRYGIYQFLRPLVIGLVHGLAGSAAVALLVLSTIHDPVWATFYLLVFGVGTLLGMMCMTAAIAVPLKYAGNRSTKVGQYLNFASGMASLCFGSFLVYQLGFVGGLFSGHPQWTPH